MLRDKVDADGEMMVKMKAIVKMNSRGNFG